MADFSLARISNRIGFRPTKVVFPLFGPQATNATLQSVLSKDAGSMTADVWKSVASVNGAGCVGLAGFRQNLTTSQAVSGRLLIDGEVLIERTFDPATNAATGTCLTGGVSANGTFTDRNVFFSESAEFQVRSSVGRTAGSSMQYDFIATLFDSAPVGASQLSSLTGYFPASVKSINETMFAVAGSNNIIPDIGDMTANTWKTVIDLTGPGALTALATRQGNTTSQQLGLKITVDGTVVGEYTRPASTNVADGISLFGNAISGPVYMTPGYMPFSHSLLVEVRTTVNRTAGSSVKLGYAGYLT
jgi:hypothetical protein